MKRTSSVVLSAAALLFFAVSCGIATAGEVAKPDGYPVKGIGWIAPVGAGSAVDLPIRAIADRLKLGVGVAVENIVGGSQTIGIGEAFRRRADGYTLISMANAGGITQPLMNDLPYKPDDFIPLAMITPPTVTTITVRPDSPLKSTQDVLDLFKSGEQYSYGTSNAGGFAHLAMVKILQQLGHYGDPNGRMILYNGGTSELVAATLNGEVDFVLLDVNDSYPRVKSGDIRVITIVHDEKNEFFPDTEIISDFGIKDINLFVGLKWVSIRKGTPPAIVEWLRQEINGVIAGEDYQNFLKRTGYTGLKTYSAAELDDYFARATREFETVMRETGLIQ